MSQAAGVENYLDRDIHNYTFTLDELMEKRLNTKIRAKAEELQEAGKQTGEEWIDGGDEDDGADGGLVGAAASAASAAAPCASPATKASSAAKGPASRGHAEFLTPPSSLPHRGPMPLQTLVAARWGQASALPGPRASLAAKLAKAVQHPQAAVHTAATSWTTG